MSKKNESADKPGSVVDPKVNGQSFISKHRHRYPLATYPDPARTTPLDPYLVLLQTGFT
jgi:hypothetical protein